MQDQSQNHIDRYRSLDEQALLAAARGYDTLTDEAQASLREEFAQRGMEAPLVEDADEFETRKLVTVRRYRDLSEAIVARGMLESAGMAVELRDENLVRLDWQVSNMIGGIRLQVDEADAAAAIELLNMPVPESIPFASWGAFEQPKCPKCGSVEITFEGASRAAALTSLYVVGLPMPPGPETWVCDTCGARWEDIESS